MSEAPLSGVRILDLTRLLPGGYATLLMADLGADVVKVEEPRRGDYVRWIPPMAGKHSAAHIALNRNKRSLALNLKTEAGRDALGALVERFDVLMESFRPGVMDKLGLGYDSLRRRNPALVYCAVTGYGQNGPLAGSAGHDVNYVGYAGILGLNGSADGPPVLPPVQVGDLAGGGMAAVVAVLAALVRRTATGEGDFCDVAMTEGALSWLSLAAASYFATGDLPWRGAMPLSGAYPCYRIYPAADGYVSVGALEPQFWEALCDALGRPDLAGEAFARGPRGDAVISELDAIFGTRTRAQWLEHFAGNDVCVGPVNDLAEALADPQLAARHVVVDGDVPGTGEFRHIATSVTKPSERKTVVRRPPPALGQHTAEILAELGIDEARYEEMKAAGAAG